MRISSLLVITNALWAFLMHLTLWNHNEFLMTLMFTSFNEADQMPVESRILTLHNSSSEKTAFAESFVLSFDTGDVEQFKQRNNHSGLGNVVWVPSVDGFQQKTLELWAKLSGKFSVINASLFDPKSPEDHGKYRSPHAVGCYLAHWHLLRTLNHREPELQPNVYFVFEDDASCIPNLVSQTLKAVAQLPPDWDMFFIGGKPFTYFPEGHNFNSSTLRHDICQGIHGKGDSPLAPDGSRQLSVDQPYWQVKSITNTHAYVVNPQRISQVMRILQPQKDIPIDIHLADAMHRGDLNVYMPTQNWCSVYRNRTRQMHHPETKWGFFHIPGTGYHYQDKLQLDNCSY